MDLGYEWKEEEMRIHWDDAATKVGEGDRNGVRSAQRNEKHAGRGLTGANANGPQPESSYLTRPHPLLGREAEYVAFEQKRSIDCDREVAMAEEVQTR